MIDSTQKLESAFFTLSSDLCNSLYEIELGEESNDNARPALARDEEGEGAPTSSEGSGSGLRFAS